MNGLEFNRENSLDNVSEPMSPNPTGSPVPFVFTPKSEADEGERRRRKSAGDEIKVGFKIQCCCSN
jgi:hypothetical protein